MEFSCEWIFSLIWALLRLIDLSVADASSAISSSEMMHLLISEDNVVRGSRLSKYPFNESPAEVLSAFANSVLPYAFTRAVFSRRHAIAIRSDAPSEPPAASILVYSVTSRMLPNEMLPLRNSLARASDVSSCAFSISFLSVIGERLLQRAFPGAEAALSVRSSRMLSNSSM